MKPVIGMLLILLGLTIGYLVISGRLPSSAGSPTPANPTGTANQGTGSGPSYSGYGAYRGKL